MQLVYNSNIGWDIMNKKVEVAVEIAKRFNSKAQAMKLEVPILDGLKEVFSSNEKIVFAVGDDYFLEQFDFSTTVQNKLDLNQDESFEERVNKNVTDIKKVLVNNSISDADDNFQDLGNFTNGIFNFRVYLQYVAREKKPICQATAYFLDPKSNSFYQLNLSMIVTDGNTVEDIFQVLKEKMVLILKGVKYRESV